MKSMLYITELISFIGMLVIYTVISSQLKSENEHLSKKISRVFDRIFITLIAFVVCTVCFITQGTYNKATITKTITGQPNHVIIDTNSTLGLNLVADKISLVPINDSVNIQQANGNTNFKANIIISYKMIKDEKSILNFYKTYGTSDVKKIVNNVIKSEVAKQDSFAKSGKISDETIKNIDKRLNHTFDFESITATDFVSSNSQNINLNTNK